MHFEETALSDNILDALYDMCFVECTPIQEKCIPEILSGRDVVGIAQTGTGKTAAYLLPILSLLDQKRLPQDVINCVIMLPTRELVQQIDQVLQGFGYYIDDINSIAVYGGNDGSRYDQEKKGLKMGANVVIATPGRLLSHIKMGNVNLSHANFFVLDEADRMLDMGFNEDIMLIASLLPKSVQTIMFSATMPEKIRHLASVLLKNPAEVRIAVNKPADRIKQSAYVCYEKQKLDIVKKFFQSGELKRVIIFCCKKEKVKDIYRELHKMKINCCSMHGDLTQSERREVMYEFTSNRKDVLVATDIVSRGIDIEDISMVINYDVPQEVEDYVHRIGRTARAERDGKAITFISEKDIPLFKKIENFLNKDIEKIPLDESFGKGPDYITIKKIRVQPRHKSFDKKNKRNNCWKGKHKK